MLHLMGVLKILKGGEHRPPHEKFHQMIPFKRLNNRRNSGMNLVDMIFRSSHKYQNEPKFSLGHFQWFLWNLGVHNQQTHILDVCVQECKRSWTY